jgi:hypothetical protein
MSNATLIETVNGASIEKMVVRSCGDRRDESGRKVWRSRTVYFVKRAGRVVPCDTLAMAREEASK